MQDFEKLGLFYLGREVAHDTAQPLDVPVLYDSRDLVTHAVCVGMTGSGKTGLCMAECLPDPRRQGLAGAPPRLRQRVGELALPTLDRSDALRKLGAQPCELLLRRDPNCVDALVLTPNRYGLVLAAIEQGHETMICACRT